jgi:hypothetical protein
MPSSSDLVALSHSATNQYVTGPEGADRFFRLRSLNAVPAGLFLLEDLLAAGALEQRYLTIEILMVSRNKSVSDVHD